MAQLNYLLWINNRSKKLIHQRLVVDYLINEIDVSSFDVLAIPGGFEKYNFYKDAYDERFLNLIRDFKKQNKIIASVCVAALPLGKSGVLKNKKDTTYSKISIRIEVLKGFGVNVNNEPIVIDDDIITFWNPSTTINDELLLLEVLTSKQNSNYIREIMRFEKP